MEGDREEVKRKFKYLINMEGDPTNYREPIASQDVSL